MTEEAPGTRPSYVGHRSRSGEGTGILLKVAGWAEVLDALGLVLPAATRIAPVLTPLAAAGLVAATPTVASTRRLAPPPRAQPVT